MFCSFHFVDFDVEFQFCSVPSMFSNIFYYFFIHLFIKQFFDCDLFKFGFSIVSSGDVTLIFPVVGVHFVVRDLSKGIEQNRAELWVDISR